MSAIVRQCPFFQRPTYAAVAGGQVLVRPYQIIVWVGIRSRGIVSPPFPAVVDTGHNFTFSIRAEQLESWCGIQPESLRRIGSLSINGRRQIIRSGELVLFRNKPGERDLLRNPFGLRLSEGLVVHESQDESAPRIPLLGLRTLVGNGLKTTVDAKRLQISISKPWLG